VEAENRDRLALGQAVAHQGESTPLNHTAEGLIPVGAYRTVPGKEAIAAKKIHGHERGGAAQIEAEEKGAKNTGDPAGVGGESFEGPAKWASRFKQEAHQFGGPGDGDRALR